MILHDWGSRGKRTVKTLSNLLPTLRERGFRVVTLTELERLGPGPGTAIAMPRQEDQGSRVK